MKTRFFVTAITEEEALKVYERVIESTSVYIESEQITNIEPYWKFEDMFVIDTDILLNCDVDSERFHEFLYKLSDKWNSLGQPGDRLDIASLTTKGCNYIIDKVEMIVIYYY